jgi:hypothetical protein
MMDEAEPGEVPVPSTDGINNDLNSFFRYHRIEGDGSCFSYALKNAAHHRQLKVPMPSFPLEEIIRFKKPVLDAIMADIFRDGDWRDVRRADTDELQATANLDAFVTKCMIYGIDVHSEQFETIDSERKRVLIAQCARLLEETFNDKRYQLSVSHCQYFASQYRINVCVWQPVLPKGIRLVCQQGGDSPAVFVGDRGTLDRPDGYYHLLYHRCRYVGTDGKMKEYDMARCLSSNVDWPEGLCQNTGDHFAVLQLIDAVARPLPTIKKSVTNFNLAELAPALRLGFVSKPPSSANTGPRATASKRAIRPPSAGLAETASVVSSYLRSDIPQIVADLQILEPGVFELRGRQIHCTKCDTTFTTVRALALHKYHLTHDISRDLTLPSVRLERLNLVDHGGWTVDSNGRFRCGVCQVSFATDEDAWRHLTRVKGHKLRVFQRRQPAIVNMESLLLRLAAPDSWTIENNRFCCHRCPHNPSFATFKIAHRHDVQSHPQEDLPMLPASVQAALDLIRQICPSVPHLLEQEPCPDESTVRDRFVAAFHDVEPAGCAVCGRFEYGDPAVNVLSLQTGSIRTLLKAPEAFMQKYSSECRPELMHLVQWRGSYYHLHSCYVHADPVDGGEFSACHKCNWDLTRDRQPQLPKYAYANGWDFGFKVELPTLNILEQALICKTQMFTSLVTLRPKGKQWATCTKVIGHIISFPHDGPQTCEKLPRRGIEEIVNILFVGPDEAYHKFVDGFRKEYEVKSEKVFMWLKFLKIYNHFYASVVINETEDDCTYMDALWDSIVSNGEANKTNDAINIELYRHAGASLLDTGGPESRDAVNASADEEKDEEDDGHNPEQPTTAGGQRVLDAVLVNLPRLQQEGSVVTAMKTVRSLLATAERDPINEFESNAYLYAAGMPHLFPVFSAEAADKIRFGTLEVAHLIFTEGDVSVMFHTLLLTP